MDLFTAKDFKVFDIGGFRERMEAIRGLIRPKLASIGEALAPKASVPIDRPLFVHVAKHARRTVNPPDDTWTALGCDSRGYKKDVHFRVSVSRNCVRLLFEAGPEYYAKPAWARAWSRDHSEHWESIRDLSLFKDEHDEEPAAQLKSFADPKKLGAELTRRRDGQIVIGSRIDAREFSSLDSKAFEKLALTTFATLAPLFNLHEARVVR
jgi:uncharacterized protein YktB (UPF0637 family)